MDVTKTLDFIPLFKRQPSTRFKMDSPTIRVLFFLGTFMDFELFEGSLCRVVLLSFDFLLLLFVTACKLSSQFCEPEGLDLLFSVKSIV